MWFWCPFCLLAAVLVAVPLLPVAGFSVTQAARSLHMVTSLLAHDERASCQPQDPFEFVDSSIAKILQCQIATDRAPQKPFLQVNSTTTTRIHVDGWGSKGPCIVDDDDDNSASPRYDDETMQNLVHLALECDAFVFEQEGLATSLHPLPVLVSLARNNEDDNHDTMQLMALLLALNQLEDAISLSMNYRAGRAPLLKVMLLQLAEQQQHDKASLASILQVLLLPTGLNLRNLAWHGFLPSIPRPWLAVVLVLVQMLTDQQHSSSNNNKESLADPPPAVKSSASNNNPQMSDGHVIIPSLRTRGQFLPILQHGEEMITEKRLGEIDVSWISPSHHGLWKVAKEWISTSQYPLCACILLTCLLEHGLRQQWCRLNQRMEDRIARSGAFYVTLDGHGQRYQHDVLLHPFVGNIDKISSSSSAAAAPSSQQLNLLPHTFGGSMVALLSDVYISPMGPNLRAALAHGSWDAILQQELSTMSRCRRLQHDCDSTFHDKGLNHDDTNEGRLWDFVRLLVAVYDLLGCPPTECSDQLEHYRPAFSFTAVTSYNLETALQELKRLYHRHENHTQFQDVFAASVASLNVPANLSTLFIPWAELEDKATHVLQLCQSNQRADDGCWDQQDVLAEHETNQNLASCGAARTLLTDIASACSEYLHVLDETQSQRGGHNRQSTRQRRQTLRVVAAKEIAITLYGFAAFSGILLLENSLSSPVGPGADREVLLKAVERSRMSVSTVSTYLLANTDRAIKSATEFARGKVVRGIVAAKARTKT